MPPTSTALSERRALAALLEEKGPLAPTLCEGWTTSDLAAHLYVRERKPLAAPGILVPQLAGLTERAMEAAKADIGYPGLLAAIRNGPPFPLSLVDSSVNTLEYFVHHEDVRRASKGWEPRVDADLDRALWSVLRRSAWLLTRRVKGVGLELSAESFGSFGAKSGAVRVVMKGGPQELLLFLVGRKDVARVSFDGPQDAVSSLKDSRFAL